jgi:subtilisin family serine protease
MKTTSLLAILKHIGAVSALLLCCILSVGEAHADTFRYRLHLNGKPGAQLATLSQRAIERRQRQGIALDSTDYNLSPTYLATLKGGGLRICAQSRWLNTVVVQRPDGAEIDTAYWERFPFVNRVDEVAGTGLTIVLNQPKHQPSVEDVQVEVGLSEAERLDYVRPIREVNGHVLHEAGCTGRGMLIAVLDGGFLNTDRYEYINRNIVGQRDFYDPQHEMNLFRTCNHGTQVLSVMTCDSSYGVWGTAPDADYFLIRTENISMEQPYEEDLWVMGAELADSLGADLINSSLGYASFDDVIYNHTTNQLASGEVFISLGAEVATTKGMLVCVAAGNERAGSWGTLLFPADVRDVLTVAATDVDGVSAYFTSPGFLYPWVKPNVACRGHNAYTIHSSTGDVAYANGTSFAAPLMCGLAASLWGAVPELTAQQLHSVICSSAEQYAQPDSILGYGHPDFAVALREARALAASSGVTTVRQDRASTRPSGLFDLMGHRLAAPPARGSYIEDGVIKVRR